MSARAHNSPPHFIGAVESTIRRENLLPRGTAAGVAVSGGADSVALLATLSALAPEWDWRLAVLHVDHALRGRQSNQDARFVERLAEKSGLPFFSEKLQWPKNKGAAPGEIGEGELREKRYEALAYLAGHAAVDVIATGHHRDDQAETVLMNLLRGSGPSGLGGIRPRATIGGLMIVRPLLDCSREEIVAFCREEKLRWREDPTNRDPRWLRNRIRHALLPMLESEYNPRLRERLAQNARHFRKDEAFFEEEARKVLWCGRKEGDVPWSLKRKRLREVPDPILARVFRLWIMAAGGGATPPPAAQIEALIDLVRIDDPYWREVRCSGDLVFFVDDDRLVLRPVPEGRGGVDRKTVMMDSEEWPLIPQAALPAEGLPLPIPGEIEVSTGAGSRNAEVGCELISSDTSPAGFKSARKEAFRSGGAGALEQHFDAQRVAEPLVVRNPRPGDRFHPLGAPGSKKLKEFLIDAGVPSARRRRLVILADAEDILWVAGVRIGHRVRLTEGTKEILRVWIVPKLVFSRGR
jgi:tRNA(Ile)-lysidine synthase